MRTQRGFSLIELLVSLVILGVVTGSIFMLLTTTQRVTRAQGERATLQSNVRTGAIVIPAELRQMNNWPAGTVDQVDVRAMTANNITYRAMRGIGFLCQPAETDKLQLWQDTWSSYRDPVAGRDSVYVFLEGAEDDRGDDDLWVPARIAGVAFGNACPGGGPSITLTINPSVVALPNAPLNGPVRTYEVMELGLYATGGESWLGARSVSGGEAALQPMLGPLADGDGLELEYRDNAGNVTGDASRVASIRVTLRGLTDQPIATGTGSKFAVVGDSLVTQVVLRNALR